MQILQRQSLNKNRVACNYRNRCWRGCGFGAYFSTQCATLPAAMKTGNLVLEVNKIVTKIKYNKDTKKRSEERRVGKEC